jgi:DNA invertase Pin-like site-specific DNA recombinase
MTARLEGYRHLTQAADLLRNERDQLITQLYQQGLGVSAIARAAGLSRRATYDILANADRSIGAYIDRDEETNTP